MTSTISTAPKVTGMRRSAGGSTMERSGIMAPTKNDAAEANAACHGLVRSFGSMRNSASTCAANASCAVSSSATVRAVAWLKPLAS